jgi:polyhydroxybutyrate depolymerase
MAKEGRSRVFLSAGVGAALMIAIRLGAQAAPRAVERQISVDGIPRTMLVYAPSKAVPAARGLVVLLHGHGGSGAELLGQGRARAAPYRVWVSIADREGLVLLAPDGSVGPDGKRGWNDCRADASNNPAVDDVAFIQRLVGDARREFGIPEDRVFIVGSSNGGHMALRIAVERPTMVRAVASIVGVMASRSECVEPTVPVSVLFMNGTSDALIPFAGGQVGSRRDQRGEVLSADASIAIWRRLANLPMAVGESMTVGQPKPGDPTTVNRTTWSQPNGAAVVVQYRVIGGGHVEPSARERYARFVTRLLGAQSTAIESADEVWRFFQLAAAQRR